MKKIFTLIACGIFMLNVSAQTFSDNFDSYEVGDYIGVVGSDWTTWSGSTGGSEDAQVTDAQSSSSPNSAYFMSTSSGGGPQDVVLPFGGEHKDGIFTFGCSFYVDADKGAYFNFQSKQVIGSEWALDCYMVNDENMYFVSDGGIVFQTTYSAETWFDLKIDINLSLNEWKCYIDNELKGTWANPINQVASIDIYPVNPESMGGNNQCSFYIDNVFYNIEEYTLPDLNGAVTSIKPVNGLVGQERAVFATIKNLGNNLITSFDVSMTYNGEQVSSTTVSTNLESLSTYEIDYSETPITLVEGAKECVVTISNVNGTTDDDATDDSKTLIIEPIVPAPGKIVLGEEGTGTWCGWCPRGAVFMDYMEEKYHGYWAGVAVHNGDPMVDPIYDAGIGSLVSGYPSALVNRGSVIDPSSMEIAFLEEITKAPAGIIENGAKLTENTLDISASIEWQMDITSDYRIACVIVEDSVTGTDAGYNQANYYSGGGSGPMGGYENLPNPVPAADMIYMHVARQILPQFEGAMINDIIGLGNGDTKVVNFTTTLNAEWDTKNMKIVTILIGADGSIDNAGYATLEEAIANGFVEGDPFEVELTFNYDVTCVGEGTDWFDPSTGTLYVAGAFNEWIAPGDEGSVALTDEDEDMIYTATIRVEADQTIAYKYFSGAGWDNGEWAGDPNREVVIAWENITVNDVDTSQCATGIYDELFGAVALYPNPFDESLNLTGLYNVKSIMISNVLGQKLHAVELNNDLEINISTADLINGVYFVTLIDNENHAYTLRVIKQ